MTFHSPFCDKASSASSLFFRLLLLVVLGVTVGCGGEDGVRGTVTFNGAPLANARIQFTPTDKTGRIASGKTDANGSYGLKTSRSVSKVFPGNYRVAISTSEVTGEDDRGRLVETKEKIPAKYNKETELTAVVNEGSNQIDFDLTDQ